MSRINSDQKTVAENIQQFKRKLQMVLEMQYSLTIFQQSVFENVIEANKSKTDITSISTFLKLREAVFLNSFQCINPQIFVREQIYFICQNIQVVKIKCLNHLNEEKDATCFGTFEQNRTTFQLRIVENYNETETLLGQFTETGMTGLCIVSGIGGRFIGEFEQNSRCGEGTFVCDNFDSYDGVWKGKLGQGVIKYGNGDQYYGDWKDYLREGTGILIRNGEEVSGEWANNVLVCPIKEDSMCDIERQVGWTINQVKRAVDGARNTVTNWQLLQNKAEDAKSQLQLLINTLRNQVSDLYKVKGRNFDPLIFNLICESVVSDQAMKNRNIKEIQDVLQHLRNNYRGTTKNNKAYIIGENSKSSNIQYQMREHPNVLIGPFKNSIAEGFCTLAWGFYFWERNRICANNWWFCEFHNNNQNGIGKYWHADLILFEGTFKNGREHGFGKLVDKRNHTYEGEYVNGQYSGRGRYESTIKECNWIYEGDWLKGWKHGVGKLTKSNGDVFIGQFQENKFYGKGKYVTSEFTYEGDFKDDQFHGNGKYSSIYGITLDGDWIENLFIGKGRYQIPSWESQKYEYEVDLHLDQETKKICGTVKMQYTNGDYFEGQFQNGVKSGYGMFVSKYSKYSGFSYYGIFNSSDNKLQNGKESKSNENQKSKCYHKVWGRGTKIQEDGDVFVGSWFEEYQNSQVQFSRFQIDNGRLVGKDGKVQEGPWNYSTFMGEKKCKANGYVSDGNFANGKGRLQNASGTRFEGCWHFEYPYLCGEGVVTYANGDTYTGTWRQLQRFGDLNTFTKYGHGKLVKKNGEVQEGYWLDDQFEMTGKDDQMKLQ